MSDQSNLGRVFDAYQNMMQIAACLREAARQRSVGNPRVLELSRRETGLSDYLPEASITRFATHEDNQPLLAEALVLPHPDKSFDGCIVSDAYEHIPSEARPGLLREMIRVADGLVLIGSPQGDEIVTRFDRIVFDFIWGKYAERFEPLEQHISFGLEPLDQTLDSLKAMGADRVAALPCNYVYRWIHQILIYFDLQHRNPHSDLFEPLNRIYNERLSTYDYREPCYRYLIAVAISPEVNLDAIVFKLKAPAEVPAAVASTEGALIEAFRAVDSTLADRLRQSSMEIKRLQSIIRRLERDNQALGVKRRFFESIVRRFSKKEGFQSKTIAGDETH